MGKDTDRVVTDAANTETIEDLVVKAKVQHDWGQEETALPTLREEGKAAFQIYVDEIVRRQGK